MNDQTPQVIYDPSYRDGLATFQGAGGFTQQPMTQQDARAIANVLGVPFRVQASR